MLTISILLVARNEEEYLRNILDDISKQDYQHALIDVILVDSLSTDKTLDIMKEFKQNNDFNCVKILKNDKVILAAGWNLALKNSTTDLVVRIDAHASIPKDFISKNIQVIKSGEKVSGGARPNVLAPTDSTEWNKTLLYAESSLFGSSIAPYRNSSKRSYVKSIFHGVYFREIFENIGYLNTKLGRTEDNEIHYRMRKNGIRLTYDPNIISYQYVRSSLKKMLKQKYANGYWIGLTLAVCPRCFSIYHFAPFAFLMLLIVTAFLFPISQLPFLSLIIIYTLFIMVNTVAIIIKTNYSKFNLLLPLVFFLLHISYGYGKLIGILSIPFKMKELKE